MIRVVETTSISSKKQALSEFVVNQDILLVASLNDKIFWRNYFLQKTDLLTDDTVQRASDFWQKLLLFVPKDYCLVSPAFLKTYLSELVTQHNIALQSDTIYRLLLDFQDILYSEDLHEIFDEWVNENVSKDEAWIKHIDDLKFVITVLEEKAWVTRDLLPALLHKYREDVLLALKDQNIFISLDLSQSVIETKLFVALAEANVVTVIIPLVEPLENFIWDYQIYKPISLDSSLVNKSKVLDMLFSPRQPSSVLKVDASNLTYREFDSLVSEVMFVIGKIRELLKAGLSPKDISILSTNKERYTLLLDTFLQIEGLHSQSTQDSSLLGVKSLQYLVGKLKLKANEIETEDLELSSFYTSAQVNYAQFSKEFTNIYQASEASAVLKKHNIQIISSDSKIDKYEFLNWFFDADDKTDAAPFTGLLNDIPESVEFKYSSWINYLQQVLQTKFLRKSTIHDGVMQVLDILESSLQENKHVFILGLNDRDLKEKQNAFIDSSDVERLATDLGFVFPSHFSQRRLMAILQILQEKNTIYLSYAKHDVRAELLEPSIFHFLLQAEKATMPPSFNLRMQKKSNDEETYSSSRGVHVTHSIDKLSATQIESFVKCPFIFYAKNVLKLSDTNILDVDVDPMTNGNIIHQALAFLVAETTWPHITDKALDKSIDAAIETYRESIKEPNLIESYRFKAKEHLLEFKAFETEWRRTYPKTKTVGIEYEIKVFLDRNGYFHTENAEGRIPFTAKMDRIDTDGNGYYVVIDYKYRLSAQHTHISSWFSKGSFQLAMYSLLLEDVKAFDDLVTVAGGLYFSIKPLQRMKGFLLKANTGLYTFGGRSKIFIDEDQKQAYYAELREKVKATIVGIESGNFSPNPLDVKLCETCNWRNTCRASHLN